MASPWWARHTQSFAARQRDAYERQGSLGWSFGAWKFDEETETSMHPAVLAQRSLRAASQAGWLAGLLMGLLTGHLGFLDALDPLGSLDFLAPL